MNGKHCVTPFARASIFSLKCIYITFQSRRQPSRADSAQRGAEQPGLQLLAQLLGLQGRSARVWVQRVRGVHRGPGEQGGPGGHQVGGAGEEHQTQWARGQWRTQAPERGIRHLKILPPCSEPSHSLSSGQVMMTREDTSLSYTRC